MTGLVDIHDKAISWICAWHAHSICRILRWPPSRGAILERCSMLSGSLSALAGHRCQQVDHRLHDPLCMYLCRPSSCSSQLAEQGLANGQVIPGQFCGRGGYACALTDDHKAAREDETVGSSLTTAPPCSHTPWCCHQNGCPKFFVSRAEGCTSSVENSASCPSAECCKFAWLLQLSHALGVMSRRNWQQFFIS